MSFYFLKQELCLRQQQIIFSRFEEKNKQFRPPLLLASVAPLQQTR
jgi:hypothetical protein